MTDSDRIPLADVGDVPVLELLKGDLDEAGQLSIEAILKQVVRPRANLGGAGPPGRAD